MVRKSWCTFGTFVLSGNNVLSWLYYIWWQIKRLHLCSNTFVETVGLIFRSLNLKIKPEDKAWLSYFILDCLV